MVDPIADADVPPTALAEAGSGRRARFRSSLARLADRSTSHDLIRWMLVPGSLLVVLGFVVMGLGWLGASKTAREIEQMPYLISGGIIGLGLVVLGGLLLVSTFWVAALRKVQQEADDRARATLADLADRVTALETPPRRSRSRAS